MKIGNLKVFGYMESIKASTYPMLAEIPEEFDNDLDAQIKRLNVAKRLGKAPIGSGHDNFLNGIVVQFDLTFTKQAWAEMERYHFVDFVSSQSTMHKLSKMSIDDACNEYVDDRVKAVMNELICEYNEDPCTEKYLRMIYSCPSGLQLTARLTTNLRQLKTIYYQRKDHRLPEWREFCEYIKECVPGFDILVLGE